MRSFMKKGGLPMAGIGFRLQELFKEDYFSSRMKAYAYAGLVTAGPWLMVVGTIAVIQWYTGMLLGGKEEIRQLFSLSVAYCFIFSQVIFSIQQLVMTRYVADLFYEKKSSRILPAFLGMSKITALFSFAAWVVFAILTPLPLFYKMLLLVLFMTTNLIWVLFLFVSAAKNYQAVAWSFLGGMSISLLFVWLGVRYMNHLPNFQFAASFILLLGFTIGMIVVLFGLLYALLVTFPEQTAEGQFAYFSYFDQYPSLFWTGFLYTAGIWVCNWLIWSGAGHSVLYGSFVYNSYYDSAIFWSYLTIVPAMIVFVVSVETRFYERYRVFYGLINKGGSLQMIEKAKQSMQRVLKEEVMRLIRIQGIFTLCVIFGISYFGDFIGMNDKMIGLFRVTAIGAFANVLVLILTLMLLYFEDRRGAMYTSIIFFILNGSITFALLPFGFKAFGIGFALGSSVAMLFALLRLIYFSNQADYNAFCGTVYGAKKRGLFFTKIGERLDYPREKHGHEETLEYQ